MLGRWIAQTIARHPGEGVITMQGHNFVFKIRPRQESQLSLCEQSLQLLNLNFLTYNKVIRPTALVGAAQQIEH